MIEGILKNS